jgi:hypothetical protein
MISVTAEAVKSILQRLTYHLGFVLSKGGFTLPTSTSTTSYLQEATSRLDPKKNY